VAWLRETVRQRSQHVEGTAIQPGLRE